MFAFARLTPCVAIASVSGMKRAASTANLDPGDSFDPPHPKKTTTPAKSILKCARCQAIPLENAVNWHNKKVLNHQVLAVDPLCRSCFCFWHVEHKQQYETPQEWISATASTDKSADSEIRNNMEEADLQAIDGDVEQGFEESFDVQQMYCAMTPSAFEDRYHCSPAAAGIKVEVLPTMKAGKGFRGVLLVDPLYPGLRFVHSRRERCSSVKCLERSVTASVSDLSAESGCEVLRKTNEVAAKLRENAPTEAQIVERMVSKNLAVPQHLLQLYQKTGGDENDNAGGHDDAQVESAEPENKRLQMTA